MLRGNLAPGRRGDQAGGRLAADLLQHRGRAVVFDSVEDMHARIDDPDLDVDADVRARAARLRAEGLPGHARGRQHAAAAEAARAGVRDMVRICDGRMSGTAYGTVVLHVAPEAAAGGPLALRARPATRRARRPGPRRLDVDVPRGRAGRRASQRRSEAALRARPIRGWERLYVDHVHAGRHRRRPRLPGRRQRRPAVARESH